MKISIVVPVYNLENYIMAMIESLKAQPVTDMEVIIVDDGSKDRSPELIGDSAGNKFKLFTIDNSGVSAARNWGLSKATGDYVLFIDGDDYLADKCVQEIIAHATGEPDIICWGFDEVDEQHAVSRSYFSEYPSEMKRMDGNEALADIWIRKTLRIGSGSAAYKRSFLIENGLVFQAGCSNGEDQEFTFKALSRAGNVLFINQVLSFYLQRQNSISNSYDIRKFEVVNALERAYEYMEKNLSAPLKEAFRTIYIGNYLYTLDASLKSSRLRNIRMILNTADHEFPGLNKKMKKAMKMYESDETLFMWRVRLFLLSPYAYIIFKRAENKMHGH